MTRCLHCGKDVVQRGDGTWVHRGRKVALHLCGFLTTKVATPVPEAAETKEEPHG